MNWEIIRIINQVAGAFAIVVTPICLANQNGQASVVVATSTRHITCFVPPRRYIPVKFI
jgi:hypothetical protein